MKLTGTISVRLYEWRNNLNNERMLVNTDNVTKTVTFTIKSNSINCNEFKWEIDNTIIEKKYKVKFRELPKPNYSKDKDNSGQPYEYLEFIDYDGPRKWASTYKGYEQVWENVVIQTWDRKELFITFRFVSRPYPRAKYENLECETVIMKLDEKSAAEFEKYINQYVA